MIASAMLPIALLTAQAAALDAGAPDAELSQQLDEILTAPAPPSEVRQTPAPASTGLLNPDISVIFDGVAGAANRARASSAGDDPDFSAAAGGPTGGFVVQEVEIGFQSNVDPFFTARVYLTIPNLTGLEVEEAYAQTTALPYGLQVKAGIFRSAVGRQNEQHLHTQDFSLRPLCNQAYLGSDGLRSPGAQVSWLLPVDVFLRLSGEILSVAPDAGPTFGGSLRSSPTFLGNVKLFLPINESWSIYLGYTLATGHAPPPGFTAGTQLLANGPRSVLYGYDLYLKYRPPNRVASYFTLALQAEYLRRETRAAGESPGFDDAGSYAQLVLQLSRRWHLGGRFDQVGWPASDRQPKGDRVSAMAMFTPSEFSRLRLQGQREKVDLGGPVYEALLLLEFAIGAHGAHPF